VCICSFYRQLLVTYYFSRGRSSRPRQGLGHQCLGITSLLHGIARFSGFNRILLQVCAPVCQHSSAINRLIKCYKIFMECGCRSSIYKTQITNEHTSNFASARFLPTFVIETDASGVAIGAILSQGNHPLAVLCP